MRAPHHNFVVIAADDHKIWHRYQAICILHNGNKNLLRHYYYVIMTS